MGSETGGVPLPSSLKEFRESQFWDSFFEARKGRPFEWYGTWPDLAQLLEEHCGMVSKQQPPLQILVPGCGNSSLSAEMYDAGFTHVTNVDFSRVVIAEMLRLHVRARPLMRWLVNDMTQLQLADSSFDVVLDKGSLDALMGEPGEISTAATNFLSEVKRVLQPGGRYICITLAQKHVIGHLLATFRQGWECGVHQVPQVSGHSPSMLQPFLVVATKSSSHGVELVASLLDAGSSEGDKAQMKSIVNAIEEENLLRIQAGCGEMTSAIGPHKVIAKDLPDCYNQLHPGRRRVVKLGGHYPSVILDSKMEDDVLNSQSLQVYKSAVFLVPKGRAHEWLFSSEEGQWQVIESAQAGRLILVMLDTQQYPGSLCDVQKELSTLVKPFLPADCRDVTSIPYLTANDGLYQRNILEEIESPMTGTIQVEDVVLSEEKSSKMGGPKHSYFRRLVFRRNPNLIQSEASLIPVKARSNDKNGSRSGMEAGRRHGSGRKKSKSKDLTRSMRQCWNEEFKVDHSCLASKYHGAMIAGLALIAGKVDNWVSIKEPIRVMIVGLGAGLLPMFVHNHLPVDYIQVVELDAVVGDVAKNHFGFVENERMQLHLGDGIEAVSATAARAASASKTDGPMLMSGSDETCGPESGSAPELALDLDDVHGTEDATSMKEEGLHILFIDADSEDPSTGLSCPPAEFLEESFLQAARGALVEGGILAINVVSRAASPHVTSVAMLRKVFEEVYDLEIDEDVNRVLFALRHRSGVEPTPSGLQKAASTLEKVATTFAPWKNGPALQEVIRTMKRLK